MKKALLITRLSRVGICISLGLTLLASFSSAREEEYQPIHFFGKSYGLNSSIQLSKKFISGGSEVSIKSENGQTVSLEVAEGSLVDGVKFVVGNGGLLRIRGALLRQCHFKIMRGGEISFDSCALDRCEFNGDSTLTTLFPRFRIMNSILYSGAWMVPMNCMGVEMLDSVVIGQRAYENLLRIQPIGAFSEYAKRPSIRYTRFEDCLIHPTLLLTGTQITIEKCQGLFKAGEVLVGTDGETPKILLPIRWVSNEPEELPATVADGVGTTKIAEAISGGCTLTAKIENGLLSMEGVVTTEPRAIQDLLPGSPGAPVAALEKPMRGTLGQADMASLRLKQAYVNGLLVMPLPSGKEAGQVTKMNMTPVPGNSSLRFGQIVGDDMTKALNEVQKFIGLRHAGLPEGMDLEIAFEEKYSGKDGPSAAVACALLVESMFTGKVWDTAFAVTGDMNADGSIQPIGGVAAKVRGATRGTCKIIGIPIQNENAVSDILILDGPAPLAGIHIFALGKFDQAVHLATTDERPVALQQAIDEFEVIRSVLMRDPRQMMTILRTPQAVTRLQAVLEKAPHSVSAKYLLMAAQGRLPKTLSLSGSIENADTNAIALVNSIENDVQNTVNTLKQDELGGSLNRLRNLRPKLDPRVWPYVDALVNYGEILRSAVLNPVRSRSRYVELVSKAQQAAASITSTKTELLSDPRVREDLGL